MKLHFISAHQNVGPLRKQIGLSNGQTHSYPLARRISSHEEEIEVNEQGLREYRELLVKHAEQGNALYKGLFTRPLQMETRKGLTDKEARTQLLVLDIDGLSIPGFKRGPATKDSVKAVAEQVIAMMPKELHSVSYVAVGSSSFGLKDEVVSVHIHMLLKHEVSHANLKQWITSLNFTQQPIYEKLTLTPVKAALRSVVDPCLAEPTRIIYIAPPFFGSMESNPFEDNGDRIVLVEKDQPSLDLRAQFALLSEKTAIIEMRKAEKLKELWKAAGITRRKIDYQDFVVQGKKHRVIANPERIIMEYSYHNEEFVYYNVNGGDSDSYWVRRDNPEIVYCFKPDEKPFLFSQAAPDAYAAHIDKFGGAYIERKDEETGETRRVEVMMFIDQVTDNYVTCEYDKANDQFLEVRTRKNGVVAGEYMKDNGLIVPDPVPSAWVVMNPDTDKSLYRVNGKTYVNKFLPTKFMKSEIEPPFVGSYGNAWQIHIECPHITDLIFHMLGNDLECFEHFINWLAFIFQEKNKAKTGWVVHGTQGTGKGMFFEKILRPLFSKRHAQMRLLSQIADDQFNGWMEDLFVLFVDEFNIRGAGAGLTRTANQLKNLVTESSLAIRKMQTQQYDIEQRINTIFATNEHDALDSKDKRRYNIPPRQEVAVKLRVVTDLMDDDFESEMVKGEEALLWVRPIEYDALLDAELDTFAAFLNHFEYDLTNVRKALQNKAKEDAQRASMSSSESFFEDIKSGNLARFVEFLDKPTTGLNQNEFNQLAAVKNIIRAQLEHANTGQPVYILRDDIRMLYSFIAGKPINQNAFGRMVQASGIECKRHAEPVGHPRMSTRPRCIEIMWHYLNNEELEQIKEAQLNTANVTPLKRDEEKQPTKNASSW